MKPGPGVGGGREGEGVPAELSAPPRRPLCLLLMLLPSPELIFLLHSPELVRFPPEILHLLSSPALRPLCSMKILGHAKRVRLKVTGMSLELPVWMKFLLRV